MYRVYRISFGRSVCVGEFRTKKEAENELLRLRKVDSGSYYTM